MEPEYLDLPGTGGPGEAVLNIIFKNSSLDIWPQNRMTRRINRGSQPLQTEFFFKIYVKGGKLNLRDKKK